jgi:HAD superfamily hydrolase (TIGR01490 family)
MGTEPARDYTQVVDEPPLRSAAFFDLDGTLIPGSSLLKMVRPLFRHGYVKPRTLCTSVFRQAKFTWLGFTDAELRAGADEAASLAAGRSATKLEWMARAFVPRVIVPTIYPEAQELISEHRSQEDLIIVISSSSREIVDPFSKAIGADDYACTVAESVDGVYTGRLVVFMHGAAKAAAVAALAARWGVDLQKSSAYSDSAGDKHMLEMVGHPYCVNPDRGLRKIAAERGWRCLRFGSQRQFLPPTRQELRRLTGRVTHRATKLASGAISGVGR